MASQTEIEEHLAHLARAVDELSQTVLAQSRTIETLERRVALLLHREAERESDGGGSVPLADQKPPHW